MSISHEQVVEYLGQLSPLQLGELIKELESKWGVKAAAPVVQGSVQTAPPGEEQREQTEYNVVLKGFPPDKKISIIKIVREVTGLGLKEAKDLVDALPKTLKEGASKAEAEELVAKVKEAGGDVVME